MRKFVIASVVVVGVGVGASLYIIPSNNDMANQQAADVKAQAPQATIPIPTPAMDVSKIDVDAEYGRGNRTLPIVSVMADKRVAAGDRTGAITALEEYVTAHPGDAAGHKKLAEQYQLAGRQDAYNKELEAIASAEPTESNLRVLSDVYNANKDYVKQAEVLKKILTVTKGEKPQVFVDLATIQLVTNDKEGALATLNDLKAKHPSFNSYSMTRILVTVLAEKSEVDKAFIAAQEWVNTPVQAVPAASTKQPAPVASAMPTEDSDPRPKELADLCNILHYSGHADKAVALVEPHIDMLQRSPELIVAYVNADVTLGRADHAYALLKKIDEAHKMTPVLYPVYIELAIKREDISSAEGIAKQMDVTAFNEEQALNIIELARANNAPTVLKTLLTRFGDARVLEGKPVLTAVIAIIENQKSQDQKIEKALNTPLAGTQRIRLAEACARAQKTPCFNAIIKQFPTTETMSPQQVAEYAQLFLIANREKEVIEPIGARAAQPNAHADIVSAHNRLAAAAGRMDILKPWLEANANTAPIGSVQELYYIANNHRQRDVASDVATRLYARDPSPANRDIMVSALLAQGQNEKALELLRMQVKDAGANDGLYLATLAKLAPKSKEARKELNDYAEAALRARRGDARQQLNYAYILINNGRKDVVVPFARAYASERGGEWKKMYAQLTAKVGKGGTATAKLTREQRIEMARSATISPATKRQIAFDLLHDGDKTAASAIFQDLAKDKGPDSQEVKDLMYLWGGKLNNEQMAWVRARSVSANAYDKGRWAELVNNSVDDRDIVRYVTTTPDALYNPAMRQKYFRVLANSGNRDNFDASMRNWVAQTTDVSALIDYATTAQAYGYRDAASHAYTRILSLDPNNKKALSQSAAIDFSKGKYSEAGKNLNQYVASTAQSPDSASESAQAHFYRAELLRREGKKAEATMEYQYVINMTAASGVEAPDALSRLYTSQFRVGRHAEAKAGFNRLLAQHPDDKGILADYMSALIEYNYLEEATSVANQYDKTSPYYRGNKGVSLQGHTDHVSAVEEFSAGRELKLHFAAPLDEKAPMDMAKVRAAEWVEQASQDYDSISISAKPGYVVRYIPVAQQQFEVVPAAAPAYSPDIEAQREQQLRLQLLYARIELQSGQTERAQQRVTVLEHYYPNDPQVISLKASMASARGNNSQAITLLKQAQAASPENEEIARTIQNLQQANLSSAANASNYVKADQAYRGLGKNDEYITTLSGAVHPVREVELGFNVQSDEVSTHQTRRASDGQIGDYDSTEQRGELYAAYTFDGSYRLQGSAFFNNDTAGGGAYLGVPTPLGNVELLGEYHRPYWDFVQAVTDGATRDRIGIRDYANLTQTLSFGLEASINNYNTELVDDVRDTGLVRVSLIQQLQAQTKTQAYWGLGYGFDGEYKIGSDPKVAFDPLGNEYNVFALVNREIHSLTAIYQDDWTREMHARLVGGVAYDRVNHATSPLIDGRIDYDLTAEWQIGARGRYALQTNNGDNRQLDLGADLIYKF